MPAPWPVDRLGPGSSREDIQAAIQATVAAMQSEGVEPATAQQQAMDIAMQRTGGGMTKLRSRRQVGALRRPGAGTDLGLGGTTGSNLTGFQYGSSGRYGA